MTLEELEDVVTGLQSSVPTLEEQVMVSNFCCYANGTPVNTVASAVWLTLASAPIPMRVLSVDLSFEYWSLTASDTNYWQAELAIHNAAGFGTPFAIRSTRSTGANANGGITARIPWNFDAAAWGTADLAKGENLAMRVAPFGTPATPFRFPMVATIRYRAL